MNPSQPCQVKAGFNLNVAFPPLNMGLLEMFRLRFKEYKNSYNPERGYSSSSFNKFARCPYMFKTTVSSVIHVNLLIYVSNQHLSEILQSAALTTFFRCKMRFIDNLFNNKTVIMLKLMNIV